MFERLVVDVEGGTADARVFIPEGPGPHPLVVQYMDAGGLRPAMTELAERLVDAGYAVLQPNLYWRAGPFAPFDWNTVWGDPDERARIMALMDSFTPEQAMAETEAMLARLDDDERVDATKIGAVGYCMGGRMTLFAAAALADRVVAGASVHGGGLVRPAPNSPHLGGPKIRAELYFAVADEDRSCTPEHCRTLGAALEAAGVTHRIELYPGAAHGFAVPDFPVYDEEAAERQWTRVLDLFARAIPR